MSTMTPAQPMGIMNQMWAAAAVSDADAIDTAVDEIRLADDLGFDSVWIGEHHGTRAQAPFYGRIPAPDMLLSYIAAKTSRIAVGSGVRILSSAPPLRTVEQMSLLHVLTKGRAEHGIGLGSFQPGIVQDRAEKARLFQAAMDEVLALLQDPLIEDGIEVCPRPSPAIAERIWVAARDEPTIRFLASRRLNIVVGQAELGVKQARYIRAYRDAGGTGVARGVRLVFVADTHAQAMRDSEEAARIYFGMMGNKGYHREAVEEGLLPASVDSPEEMRRQVDFLVGDPVEVADALNLHAATTGVDRLDVMVQIPGLKTDAVRRSMTLLQQEVRPRLQLRGIAEA